MFTFTFLVCECGDDGNPVQGHERSSPHNGKHDASEMGGRHPSQPHSICMDLEHKCVNVNINV